ncbi:MAG: hypothetical protein MUE81_16270 [Thermoflexibacter sp.]|jgi:hypothetical protein|nr:hypothetical protein [Thermoflexibacter sp.]
MFVKENKNYLFFKILLSLLITRLLDGLITYLVTPDLKYEANPIESVLGWGWIGLFVFNLLVVGVVIYLTHLHIYTNFNNYPTQKYNLKQFISYYFFNTPNQFYRVFYSFPKNRKAFAYAHGYILPRTLIAFGIVIIVHNLLQYLHGFPYFLPLLEGYISFCWNYKWVIGLALTIIGSYFYLYYAHKFFRIEYRNYQKQIITN